MKIDTFTNRLNEALRIRNIKASEIVKRSEILFEGQKINRPLTKPLLSHYLKGTYEAGQENVFTLSLILNIDEGWLMGLDVPMEREQKLESNVFPNADIPIRVPVLGKISAGLPILAVENIERYEFAPSSYIKKDYDYFYLTIQGDSMNLKFNEGDIVLVQKQDTLENNEIGAILVNGFDATVKRYKSENGLIILEPMSTNPENITQIYNPKEIEIKIIGKIVSYQGKI